MVVEVMKDPNEGVSTFSYQDKVLAIEDKEKTEKLGLTLAFEKKIYVLKSEN